MTKHFCDTCGKEISAQWWTFNNLDLCRTCYEFLKWKSSPTPRSPEQP